MAQVQPSLVRPPPGSSGSDQRDSARVVAISGEHDPSTVSALSEMIRSTMAIDADLVVDASEVTFLDASTIGVLIWAQNLLRDRSRSLIVRSPSTCVSRILQICDLVELMESVEGANPADQPATAGGALETWVAVPPEAPTRSRP